MRDAREVVAETAVLAISKLLDLGDPGWPYFVRRAVDQAYKLGVESTEDPPTSRVAERIRQERVRREEAGEYGCSREEVEHERARIDEQ